MNGNVIPYARIVLYPDAERGNGSLEVPRARVDPNGVYSLKTGKNDGVRAGWYRVAIVAHREPGPDFPLAPPVWLANVSYADPKTSGLEVEVKPNPAAGVYDFDLLP